MSLLMRMWWHHLLSNMRLVTPRLLLCCARVSFAAALMQDKELALAVALDFQLQLNFQLCPALSWCAAGPVKLIPCCFYTTGK
ncbi:hypothetical protein DV515_00007454 [Chloebia gouldiae]|uniref:Secreted protein n=1 Tax=Chloebia gouldiae TaxID=44316 RepID=A0A3L8SJH6_CHLGU|nr:hypothetical protein DV515_00007454 [Chloebia gouldiae]